MQGIQYSVPGEEDMDRILKAIVSAAVGYLVPVILKQFLPEPEKVESLPWLKWIVAGFVGGALGSIVSGAMGLVLAGVGNWAAFGTAIGLMQWFALRGYRDVGGWFVFSSAVGWMIFNVGGPFGWVICGIFVGLMQYLGLTRYKGAGWWIVGNAVAWPVAGWVGIIVGMAFIPSNPILAWIAGWGVVGMMGAIILLFPLKLTAEK
jgi:hypothetical protein